MDLHQQLALLCQAIILLSLGKLTNPLPVENVPLLDRISASPEDNWFLDQFGRVRIFHGVNIVKKEFPWYHEYLFNDTRLDQLKEWGFNIVRLGTMWAGAEPSKGQMNATYIRIIKDAVQRLSSHGIYTLLDMHQDCLTSKYEAYDGVPRWLVDSFPEPTNQFPWPLTSIGAWEENYLTQAVSEAFQHFYNNVSSSVDAWANFWGTMANNFNNNPAVIGYNLMNEPWIGNFYSDIKRAYPGIAGRENLLPAYDVINKQIRQHDNKGIIFYEPVIYGQLGHGKLIGSGFDRVPGGTNYRGRSAFSFHTYCWPLEFLDKNATDEKRREARDYCYNTFLPNIMKSSAQNVQMTGGARMLTEFGLCNGDNDPKINVECKYFLDLCDENLVSWIEWDYNDGAWYAKGNPVMNKVRPHVRPYAPAIAGVPTYMNYNEKTGKFILEFISKPKIAQPTEIFLPKLVYTRKVDIVIQGPAETNYQGGSTLKVYNVPGSADDDRVLITVTHRD